MRYKRKSKPVSNITIAYDDRENKPWLFLKRRWPMAEKRLKVGDYTILGYENKIAIEKKSGMAELLSDLTGKERPRFEQFLKKMSQYPVKAIVVEDPFECRVIGSVVTTLQRKSSSGLTTHTIYHWAAKITIEYGIPVLFVDRLSREEIVTKLIEQCIIKAEKL